MLTPSEWRQELRDRQRFALDIALANDNQYGFDDERTRKAYRAYDAISVVARIEGA